MNDSNVLMQIKKIKKWHVFALNCLLSLIIACSGADTLSQTGSAADAEPNIQATIDAQVQATLEHAYKAVSNDSASVKPNIEPAPISRTDDILKPTEIAHTNIPQDKTMANHSALVLDKTQAISLYPPDIATNVLARFIEWPMDFEDCITKSIAHEKLNFMKDNPDSIGGMDKDAAALCLLSVALANPGSTDYIKNTISNQSITKGTSSKKSTSDDQAAKHKGPSDTGVNLDKNQATALYQQDVTSNVLSGAIEWPLGFEDCILESISESKLNSFKENAASIGGMDRDETALCLLSLELNSPGLTDYIKNSSNKSASGNHSDDKTSHSSGNEIIIQAQELFAGELYGNMVSNILIGSASPPEGFDDCISDALGPQRFLVLRDSLDAGPGERDDAMVCLFSLGYQPDELILSTIPVQEVYSVYEYGNINTKSGPFRSGQNADIALGVIDFNKTGGPLLFNHPSGIATDGVRLLLVDSYNNRILIWNTLPEANEPPDLVLGQENFNTNSPGTGRSNMNWPKSISTDGQKIVVTDTYNDRILIWTEFPTENGEAADIVLQGYDGGTELRKNNLLWPWGVWTDGTKLAVTSTKQAGVLIWNTFPTRDNQSADISLTGGGALGTPRQITSDGKSMIVGDHNASIDGQRGVGTFFWKTFPEEDEQPYDFYMSDPIDLGTGAPWMRGDFTPDGKLLALGSALYVWDSFPEDELDTPELSINGGYEKWGASFMKATDHTTLAIAGEKVFITTNYHTVSVYNSIPTTNDQKPDFVIGGPDIYTNTLKANNFLFNPIPASDGNSLFVVSDAGYFYVWKNIPQESGPAPDYIYSIGPDSIAFSVGDISLYDDTLILGGRDMILKWNQLPLSGESPDILLKGQVGSVKIGNVSNESLGITGVAMDEQYFYMALSTDEIYVWEGFPDDGVEPLTILRDIRALNLHSDGQYLVASNGDKHTVTIYRISELLNNPTQNVIGGSAINGAAGSFIGNGQLFVADNGFSRIHIWNDVEDAIRGRSPDALIGNQNTSDAPQIGQDKLFLPKFLTYDGTYLWVGEVKFSNRLLRYSHN